MSVAHTDALRHLRRAGGVRHSLKNDDLSDVVAQHALKALLQLIRRRASLVGQSSCMGHCHRRVVEFNDVPGVLKKHGDEGRERERE